jgi:3-dehydroquinate synthase
MFSEAKTVAVITDKNVQSLYLGNVVKSLEGSGFRVISYAIEPGEQSKNGMTYLKCLNWLAENSVTRTDVILALGGGVVGDLAGFVAATYLRGVAFVQAPTTLLSMVDSSVGGKTAIDLDAGKNLAGTFYQPSLVLCDTLTLQTLPEHIMKDGIAEVIKYGMLGSRDLLNTLDDGGLERNLVSVIAKCVAMKRDIVETDEFDTGERMILNLGHTIGHAIEKLSGYRVSHGCAVAIGMAIDTKAAVEMNLCHREELFILQRILSRYDLPQHTDFSAEEIFKATLSDKKRSGGEITNVVPVAAGKSELRKIPVESLFKWIELGLYGSAGKGENA